MTKKKNPEEVPVEKPEVETVNKKPRAIVTTVSDNGTFSTRIKTTRELYMEVLNNEKN